MTGHTCPCPFCKQPWDPDPKLTAASLLERPGAVLPGDGGLGGANADISDAVRYTVENIGALKTIIQFVVGFFAALKKKRTPA